MATWTRIRALSAGDWAVLVAASAGLCAARAGLARTRFAASAEPAGEATPAQLARAQAIAALVGAASRRMPFATTCLHRSLVLWRLLRRRGIPAAIHLGTRMQPGPFEAHAWVSCGDVPVGEVPEHLATYHAFEPAVVPRARRGS